MIPSRILLLGAVLSLLTPSRHAEAVQPRVPSPTQPFRSGVPVSAVDVTGAQELDRQTILAAAGVEQGAPLTASLADIAAAVERAYHEAGFTFAEVTAAFDETSGTVTLRIEEGRIDAVEFTGVADDRAQWLADDFAMRAGDVFNRLRARDALQALLRPTRGAIQPARRAFEIVQRNGSRVLLVDLEERAGAVRTSIDMGEREDWFTPVDGLVPSLGIGGALFDQTQFNHAYLAAHLSYKTASRRAGYSLGFERPLFGSPTVFVGGELYDLTATDDRWQISGTQASLAAISVRENVRDYYRRRGVQLQTAIRPHPRVELHAAWRGERHTPLVVESDFSVWNGDDEFRPNRGAAAGRLNALVVGAAIDSIGFHDDSLAATYRRHQLDAPFGNPLRHPDAAQGRPMWRLEWYSELSSPAVLHSDFDFHRHVASGRVVVPLSRHEEVRARAIGGWSGGVMPPQRQFSLGGIGSVHGYGLKEAVGTRLALFNVEYAVGRLNGLHIVPFFDAGRVAGTDATPRWLHGVGFGLGLTRDIRVDLGYKLNDVPGKVQVLLRLGRTF